MKRLDYPFYSSITYFALFYLNAWHFIWAILSLTSFVFILYFWQVVPGFNFQPITVASSILLLKSLSYLRIGINLKTLFFKKSFNQRVFKETGWIFLILFLLDLISIFFGSFNNSLQKSASLFLQIIPSDSVWYSIYSKAYLYIPSIFDFIHPVLNGTSLLIAGVLFFSLGSGFFNLSRR